MPSRTTLTLLSITMMTLLAGSATPADADELVLADGSRLVGRVTGMAEGKVTIETAFAGVLKIDTAKVQGVTLDRQVMVQTRDGQRTLATLAYAPATGQTVRSGADGSRRVSVPEMVALWSPGELAPDLEKARPKWSVRAEVGVGGQTGNKELVAGNLRAAVRRQTPSDRFKIYGLARYSREDGTETAREFIGGSELEVDLSPRVFTYGRVEFEHDRFEDLDLRAIAAGGLGYFLLREPRHELKVRGGLGYKHEALRRDGTRDSAIGEAGYRYLVEVREWLNFTSGVQVAFVLDDPADLLLTAENAVEVPLSKDKAWKLRAGVRNQFDNRPEPGIDELDTYYFLNLVADWK